MQLVIQTYGIAREILGSDAHRAEFTAGITAGELLEELKLQFPQLVQLNSIIVAVNATYVDAATTIKEGDEIALIPPVSGG
jgi:molybdopterin converting factor subunit 1